MPGNVSRREILFVKDQDPAQEHWTGPLAQRGRGASANRHRDGVDRPASSSRSSPAMLIGRRLRRRSPPRSGALLRRAVGRSRPRGARARRRPRLPTTADAAARVRAADSRSLRRLRDRRRAADLRRSAHGEDAVRAEGAGQEPRDLERRADGRHARRAARRLRVRSEGGDRGGASRARRRLVELSVDRRQRAERDDPALPATATGRCRPAICCSSTRPATTTTCPATSRAPIRSAARSRRRRRTSTRSCCRRRRKACRRPGRAPRCRTSTARRSR